MSLFSNLLNLESEITEKLYKTKKKKNRKKIERRTFLEINYNNYITYFYKILLTFKIF